MVSKLLGHQDSESVISQQDDENIKRGRLKDLLDEKTKQSNMYTDRMYIDIYSPRGQHKIRVTHSPNQRINIASKQQKKLELEHIENSIESMSQVPDFGYNIISSTSDGKPQWRMLYEFLHNMDKYERLQNYI